MTWRLLDPVVDNLLGFPDVNSNNIKSARDRLTYSLKGQAASPVPSQPSDDGAQQTCQYCDAQTSDLDRHQELHWNFYGNNGKQLLCSSCRDRN